MTDAGWTKPPLDYVPVSRLDGDASCKPTNWTAPHPMKRAAIAGIVAAAAVAVIVYLPYVALAALAIGTILVAVWLAGKWADRLNALDGK